MNIRSRFAIVCVALVASALGSSVFSRSRATGRIVRVASMHDRRADHSSTLLPDGRVLIAGGMEENGKFLDSAELFDPRDDSFVAVANMQFNRVEHTATLLANGKVLIAGGLTTRPPSSGISVTASTEIYDPAIGGFAAGPTMTTPRTGHAAVALANHKILIVGGVNNNERAFATAEIYDPSSNEFTATTSMHTARVARSAVLLQDGRVLVTGGGDSGRSAEVFDPSAATWTAVGDMTAARQKHAATLLPNGRVLITGGAPDSYWHPVRTAEIFDPHTNRFTAASDMELARFKLPGATATLKNGEVLVAGGAADVEVYNSATGKFTLSGSVAAPHFFAAATALQDGRVLITGGYGFPNGRPNGPVSTEQAWLYLP